MPRTTYLCAALLSLALGGCGDPKGAAGAIGAPAQSMDPSKMNKSAKDAEKIESKFDPQDSRAIKLNPGVPDAQQKVIPAPVDEKGLKATPVAPLDQKAH